MQNLPCIRRSRGPFRPAMTLHVIAVRKAVKQDSESLLDYSTMPYFVAGTLLISGLIHLLPSVGFLGTSRLELLYGIAIAEPNLEILMRHRAGLFGILGVFFVVAAFTPALRGAAFAVGLASVASFVFLAWSINGHSAQLSRIVTADILAFVLLLSGFAMHVWGKRGA
jgi:hypothetical protein